MKAASLIKSGALSLARYLYNLSAVRQTLISINQAPLFLTYIIIFNGARLWVTPIKQAHYNCYFLVSGGQSIVDLVPGNTTKKGLAQTIKQTLGMCTHYSD
jgi:hypothetical protein